MRYELAILVLFCLQTSFQQTADCDDLAKLLGNFKCVKNDKYEDPVSLNGKTYLVTETEAVGSNPKQYLMIQYNKQEVNGDPHPFDEMMEFRKGLTLADDWIFHPDKTIKTEDQALLLFSNAKRLPEPSAYPYFMYKAGEPDALNNENKELSWNAVLNIVKTVRKTHEHGYFFNCLHIELFCMGKDPSDLRLIYANFAVKAGKAVRIPTVSIVNIEPETLDSKKDYIPTEATDAYSLGVLLFSLANKGKAPMLGLEIGLQGEYRIRAGFSLELAYIVHGCLLKDSSKRFKMKDVEEVAKMALANPTPRYLSKNLDLKRTAEFPEEERAIVQADLKTFAAGGFEKQASGDSWFKTMYYLNNTPKAVLILLLLLMLLTVGLIVYFCFRKSESAEADETDSNQNQTKAELVEVSAKE